MLMDYLGRNKQPFYHPDIDFYPSEPIEIDEYDTIIDRLNLDEVERGILRLICHEDFSHEEIAQMLEVHPLFINISLKKIREKNYSLKSEF